MAEVEKMTTTVVNNTADIPGPTIGTTNTTPNVVDLGTSPTQERSSNSHHSEYDTASDLEGDYDYDETTSDLSEDDEDYEGDSDSDSAVDGGAVEKLDAEAQKKVDEDRSNPQYIPKRGTFYEHDDRTAEDEGGEARREISEQNECDGVVEGGAVSVGPKSSQSPEVSQATKPTKKWQPASGVDRWSHDRFDPNEQAPKSRSELVSAYGYDIRTEDAPPRARRRRRYGRGPSKYSRNWEDENAYLRASNKERKPPRPGDFPALGTNIRRSKDSSMRDSRGTREEKENLMEQRRQNARSGGGVGEKQRDEGSRRDYDDRREGRNGAGPRQKQFNNNTPRSNNAPVGRQAAMEFKQKQRGRDNNSSQHNNRTAGEHNHNNEPFPRQSYSRGQDASKPSGKSENRHHMNETSKLKHSHNDVNFNNSYQQQQKHTSPHQQSQQQAQSHSNNSQFMHTQLPPTNLTQRLQQVQNRNDPSHVGSVQMNALASQNQMVVPSASQPTPSQNNVQQVIMAANQTTPSQPQPQIQGPQEQRGQQQHKRYSNMRRTQHSDAPPHLAEQHQLQPQLIMPDQHIMQANLMQLYHQENLQAQMQSLQVTQSPGAAPPPNVPKPAGYPPNAAQAAPAAYFVAAPAEAYPAAPAAPNTAYVPPPSTNYLPQATAAPVPYGPAPNTAATVLPPPAPAAAVVPPSSATGPNYPNYHPQNFNTVGGTTYFVPPPSRPAALPQRRPTNAIPILPPSAEKNNKQKSGTTNELSKDDKPALGSSENIDHILDNMFVQRPAFQPPLATTGSVGSVSAAPQNASPVAVENESSTAAQSSQESLSNSNKTEIAVTADAASSVSATAASESGSAALTQD